MCVHWTVTIDIIYKTSSVHLICAVTTVHLLHTSAWMVYHHLNNWVLKCFNSMKIINNFSETLYMAEKGKSPLVGVEPNASHLPDKCPRLLDHRGFLICHRSLFQVIHVWSLNCDYQYYLQDVICALHLHSYHCTSAPHIYLDGLPSSK